MAANQILRDMFDSCDTDRSNSLDKEETLKLFNFIPDVSATDIDAFLVAMDTDGNGMIDREEFNSGLLRCDRWKKSKLTMKFNSLLLDPALADESTFVAGLEDFITSHVLFKHHLLDNLATGAFGTSTPVKLFHYLEARSFINYVLSLIQIVYQYLLLGLFSFLERICKLHVEVEFSGEDS